MKTAIVIPALNAEGTLPVVIPPLRHLYPEYPLILVNDGSRDSTSALARRLGAETIDLPENRGVGHAIAIGVQRAYENGADVIVTIGADAQRNPADVARLLEPVHAGETDLCSGSKLMSDNPIPLPRLIANRILRYEFNRIHRTSMSDVTSGFRAFNRAAGGLIHGLPERYTFDVAFYSRILRSGLRWTEIAVNTFYGSESTRMRSPILEGLRILNEIHHSKPHVSHSFID